MGKLLVLFIVVPAVELALLIQIGIHLGTLPTVALIVLTGMLGAYLARWQGLSVVRQAQEQMGRGELPAGSLADGVMILVAGALLMTPGIVTDVVGFSLLVPAIRDRIKTVALARFRRAVEQNRVRLYVSGIGPDMDDMDDMYPIDGGPVVDVQPEGFEPDSDPPKYKVH